MEIRLTSPWPGNLGGGKDGCALALALTNQPPSFMRPARVVSTLGGSSFGQATGKLLSTRRRKT